QALAARRIDEPAFAGGGEFGHPLAAERTHEALPVGEDIARWIAERAWMPRELRHRSLLRANSPLKKWMILTRTVLTPATTAAMPAMRPWMIRLPVTGSR